MKKNWFDLKFSFFLFYPLLFYSPQTKNLNKSYYAEVRNFYKNFSKENTIFRERKETKFLRTEHHVKKETKTGRNQEVIRNENEELEIKPYPKRKKNIVNTKTDMECQL